MAELNAEQLPELDLLILSGKTILGIKLIRDATGLSLHASFEEFAERFEYLKQTRPAAFTTDLDHYWDGFYS